MVKQLGITDTPLTAASVTLQQAIMRFRQSLVWGLGADAFSHLPFLAGSFDLVLVHPAAHHLRSWQLSELLRLLRPGGCLKFVMRSWPRDLERVPRPLPGVLPLMDPTDAVAEMRAVGFARVAATTVRAADVASVYAFFPTPTPARVLDSTGDAADDSTRPAAVPAPRASRRARRGARTAVAAEASAASASREATETAERDVALRAQADEIAAIEIACLHQRVGLKVHRECNASTLEAMTEQTAVIFVGGVHACSVLYTQGEAHRGEERNRPVGKLAWSSQVQRQPLGDDAIAAHILRHAPHLRVIILNACETHSLCAQLHAQSAGQVSALGWRGSLSRDAARRFGRSMFGALGAIVAAQMDVTSSLDDSREAENEEEREEEPAQARALNCLRAALEVAMQASSVAAGPTPEPAWHFAAAAAAAAATEPDTADGSGSGRDREQQLGQEGGEMMIRPHTAAGHHVAAAAGAPALSPTLTILSAEVHRPLVVDPNCELICIDPDHVAEAAHTLGRARARLESTEALRPSMKRDKRLRKDAAALEAAEVALARARRDEPELHGVRSGDTPLIIATSRTGRPSTMSGEKPIGSGYTEPWGEPELRLVAPGASWAHFRGSKGVTGVGYPRYHTHPYDDCSMYFEVQVPVPATTTAERADDGAGNINGGGGGDGPELLIGWAAAGSRLEQCTWWGDAMGAADDGHGGAGAGRMALGGGIGSGLAVWVSSRGGGPCCSLPHAVCVPAAADAADADAPPYTTPPPLPVLLGAAPTP
jgi:hypothetical protein